MTTKHVRFISDKDRKAAENKGRAIGQVEGLCTAAEIIRLLKDGVPMTEVAQRLKVSPAVVEKISFVVQ